MNWEPLLAAAIAARSHSHSPYSRFAVGAAVETESGEIFGGANVENRSFGVTLCAERSAFAAAVSAGHRRFRGRRGRHLHFAALGPLRPLPRDDDRVLRPRNADRPLQPGGRPPGGLPRRALPRAVPLPGRGNFRRLIPYLRAFATPAPVPLEESSRENTPGCRPVASPSPCPPSLAAADPQPPELRLPEVARPTAMTVDLTILPEQETFDGKVGIDLELASATSFLWLNARHLEIQSATLTAAARRSPARVVAGGDDFVGFDFGRERAGRQGPPGDRYRGKLDAVETEGLFRQKDGEDWYVFSQFESTFARRAFPCFDEPSYRTPWQLTLHVKEGNVAVSNAPVVASRPEANGMKAVEFAPTKPISSYLVALGVGPFTIVDAGTWGRAKTPGAHGRGEGQGGADRLCVRGHRTAARRARGVLRDPLPVRQARQPGDPADGRLRRDGEPRSRHLRRPADPRRPGPPDARAPARLRRNGGARERPHVVRRLRHHEVVGRHLAERRLRHLDGGQDRRPVEARVGR